MYNANPPNETELPSSARLFRSTVIAAASAAVLLVTVVMPAEYGLDPTGAGRILGLTEMGAIKQQLAQEAATDAGPQAAMQPEGTESARLAAIEQRLDEIAALLALRPPTQPAERVSEAPAAEPAPTAPTAEPAPAEPAVAAWKDEVTITLTPGQGIEYKLVMAAGAEADFEWSANGGALNFDTHGDGPGNSVSYEKGRGVATDSGVLKAAFDGNHGWFWRNRTNGDVTLTLRTRGNYSELKRTA